MDDKIYIDGILGELSEITKDFKFFETKGESKEETQDERHRRRLLGLIVKIRAMAKKRFKQMPKDFRTLHEEDDWIQEGMIALISESRKYQPREDCDYEKYMLFVVRRRLSDLQRSIFRKYTPVDVDLRNLIASKRRELGREPTHEEISQLTGLRLEDVSRLLSHRIGSTRFIQSWSDTVDFVESSKELADARPSALDNLVLHETLESLYEALEYLETTYPQLAFIVRLRASKHTFTEIARLMSVPEAKIRSQWKYAISFFRSRMEKGEILDAVIATEVQEQGLLRRISRIFARRVIVELTVDDKLNSFSTTAFVQSLTELISPSIPITLIDVKRGSVKITLELDMEQAEQLLWLYHRGALDILRILDAKVLFDTALDAVLQQKAATSHYDVFMCHNSIDKAEVIRIGIRLRRFGILPWLDEWELRPGLPWHVALEKQIELIKSAAVFVGASGIGPWQDMELSAFIRQFVSRKCPVIPVILRSCNGTPPLPVFLDGMTWVNFKKRVPDPFGQLVWGITGRRLRSAVKA